MADPIENAVEKTNTPNPKPKRTPVDPLDMRPIPGLDGKTRDEMRLNAIDFYTKLAAGQEMSDLGIRPFGPNYRLFNPRAKAPSDALDLSLGFSPAIILSRNVFNASGLFADTLLLSSDVWFRMLEDAEFANSGLLDISRAYGAIRMGHVGIVAGMSVLCNVGFPELCPLPEGTAQMFCHGQPYDKLSDEVIERFGLKDKPDFMIHKTLSPLLNNRDEFMGKAMESMQIQGAQFVQISWPTDNKYDLWIDGWKVKPDNVDNLPMPFAAEGLHVQRDWTPARQRVVLTMVLESTFPAYLSNDQLSRQLTEEFLSGTPYVDGLGVKIEMIERTMLDE